MAVRGLEPLEPRRRHVARHHPLLLRDVEDVGVDGHDQRRLADAAQHRLELAAPAGHVVGVHGAGERVVGGGVEAIHELLPLVAQVALHGEEVGRLGAPAVALLEALPSAVGAHGHHARRGQARPRAGRPGRSARPPSAGRRRWPGAAPPRGRWPRPSGAPSWRWGRWTATMLREEQRPLQHLHPAQRAADDGADAPDPEGPAELPLHPDHVTHGDGREGAEVGSPGGRVDRGRPGGAVAAPQDVGADDEVAFRVEGAPRAEHLRPPAVGVGRSGEGVADHHRVVAGRGEAPPGPVGDLEPLEPGARLEEERPGRDVPARLRGDEGRPRGGQGIGGLCRRRAWPRRGDGRRNLEGGNRPSQDSGGASVHVEEGGGAASPRRQAEPRLEEVGQPAHLARRRRSGGRGAAARR